MVKRTPAVNPGARSRLRRRESSPVSAYPTAKRGLNLVVALMLVILLSPVFAAVAIVMGLDMALERADRGP
jgi:lipopolysaccharide/colanic/teichoic acid biosynthesis glycosyltransferase